MVRGLYAFQKHFAHFKDHYVLIGGTACMLAMEEAGLDFRATKDLDIVLCIEALDVQFIEAFWDFIKKGNYQFRQKSTGEKRFYRFHSPENPSYPYMLELFSRKPDAIALYQDSHLTPIPVEDEISSLSAILLDEHYYRFIHKGKREIEGLSTLGPEHLIPLKAIAWTNLSKELSTDARKHKNDIIRLYQLLVISSRIHLPDPIKQDMLTFLEELKKDPLDPKTLGLKNINIADVIENLSQIYMISR